MGVTNFLGSYRVTADGVDKVHCPPEVCGGNIFSPGFAKQNLEKFSKKFSIVIHNMTETELEFDIKGISLEIKQAIRKAIMSEVPVMAIDRLEIIQNTSHVYDEKLEIQIGHTPIKADPNNYDFRESDDEPLTYKNCIFFKLNVNCRKTADDPHKVINVYSKDLIYTPIKGSPQLEGEAPQPVDKDIILTRLKHGQEVSLFAYCTKKTGKTNSKFAPAHVVSSNISAIEILRKVEGEEALRLQQYFPEGVIEVVEIDGEKVAKVGSRRLEKTDRNVFMDKELQDAVSIHLMSDHHAFTIEGTGCYPAKQIFEEGVKFFIRKFKIFSDAMDEL